MWMQENFRSELSKNLNMGVLILKQIYEEAERQVAPHMARQVERSSTCRLSLRGGMVVACAAGDRPGHHQCAHHRGPG